MFLVVFSCSRFASFLTNHYGTSYIKVWILNGGVGRAPPPRPGEFPISPFWGGPPRGDGQRSRTDGQRKRTDNGVGRTAQSDGWYTDGQTGATIRSDRRTDEPRADEHNPIIPTNHDGKALQALR